MGMTVKAPLAMLLLASVLIGCASERSASAFCSTLDAETTRLSNKYDARFGSAGDAEDPLLGLLALTGGLLEAQGDMVVLFSKLKDVAPDEIRTEVELLHDTAKKQADATADGDISEMLIGGLVSGLQSQGAQQAVDDFISRKC